MEFLKNHIEFLIFSEVKYFSNGNYGNYYFSMGYKFFMEYVSTFRSDTQIKVVIYSLTIVYH